MKQLKNHKELAERQAHSILGYRKPLDLMIRSREQEYTQLRFISWYILKNKYKYGVLRIGKLYNMHYSTITSGIRRAENLKLVDKHCV